MVALVENSKIAGMTVQWTTVFQCVSFINLPENDHPIWFDKLYAPDTNSWNDETDYNWHAPLA